MVSFYPGPSSIHDEVVAYIKDAHQDGIMSMNHRSKEFMSLCEKTVALLKEKLIIPESHTVLFTSSATECWETLAQSLVQKQSVHVFNGAFGEKWYEYTKRLKPNAKAVRFDKEGEINRKEFKFSKAELICITQNETSNGTQVSNEIISFIQKKNPKALIAVDATSSMAGIQLDFEKADIWFASVQKCFGLPAGLAVMTCSPKAIAKIKSLNEKKHYNSLLFMLEMMDKWQTPYTPNVLGIYLLMRVLEDSKSISFVHKQVEKRANAWQDFFEEGENLRLYIQNPAVRSLTVLTITGTPDLLATVKRKAKKKGFLLGEGYGALKNETFRIANFPAIKSSEIKQLMGFLKRFL